MPRVFIVAVLFALITALFGSRPVAAQYAPGNITAFADPTGTSCSITDQTPGPFNVYVFHTNFGGMYGVNFRVSESGGFHATYLSETLEAPGHYGDFRNGIDLVYGACRNGPVLLGTISYEGHGTSESCSYLDIVGWHYPWPETGDCIFMDYPAPPLGKLYVNPQPGLCQPWCGVVATAPATWGKVKALYRD
ncbi:MAG TPA: hypothetical protein VF247_10575 [Candidatus Krumholzibacteria bacterium]